MDLPVWMMDDDTLQESWLPTLRDQAPYPLKVIQATLEAFFDSRMTTKPVTDEPVGQSGFSGHTTHPKDQDFTHILGLSATLPGRC